MKKFTGNFLLDEHSFGSVLRRIGLSMVGILMAVGVFAQAQETYHVWAEDTTFCYQDDNRYEVPIYMRDFIKIDKFSLELEYNASIFSYVTILNPIDTLSSVTVTEGSAGVLTISWDDPGVSTIGETILDQNAKTKVFTLQFSQKNVPYTYGAVDASNQYAFSSDLHWDKNNSMVWNDVQQISQILTDFTADGNLEVTQGIKVSQIDLDTVAADCDGGIVEITVAAPAGDGYTYSFDGGTTFESSNVTDVQAPKEDVTLEIMKDGCISYIYKFDVDAPAELGFTAPTPVYTRCPGGLGDLSIYATGGSGAYTYYVVPDSMWATVTSDFDDASNKIERNDVVDEFATPNYIIQKPAGTLQEPAYYWVAVQDGNECKDLGLEVNIENYWKQVAVIDTLDAFYVTGEHVDNTCYLGPTVANGDGSIELKFDGGTPYNDAINGDYGYRIWFNNVEQSAIDFYLTKDYLKAGDYSIYIEDAKGCDWDTIITVTEPDPIVFQVNHTDAGCEADNGTITMLTSTIVGGTGVENAGFTDGSVDYTALVAFNPNAAYWIIDTLPQVNRPGSGTQPLWYGNIEGQTTVTGLPAGVYYIGIVDEEGCFDDYTNINGDNAVKVFTYDIDITYQPIKCNGDSTYVTVSIDAPGHTIKYRLVDTDAQYVVYTTSSNNVFKLPAGNWRAVVEDETIGCTYRYNFEITEPDPLTTREISFLTLPPTCIDNTDGNLVIKANGGTPFIHMDGNVEIPYYKYKMDDGDWIQTSDYNTFAVDTGRHTVYVEDAAGCRDTFKWYGFETDVNFIDFEDTIYTQCNGDEINLFNSDPFNDGELECTYERFGICWDWAIVPGAPQIDMGWLNAWTWYGNEDEHETGTNINTYTYWTSDSGWVTVTLQGHQQQRHPMLYISDASYTDPMDIVNNGEMIGHMSAYGAGTYYVVGMDEWGCMSNVDTITIIEPKALEINVTAIGAGCDGATDGKIMIEAFNGMYDIPGTPAGKKRYQYVLTQQPQIFANQNWVDQVSWVAFTNGVFTNDSLSVISVQDGTYWVAVRDYCAVENPDLIQFWGPIVIAGAEAIEVNNNLVQVDSVTCIVRGETHVYDGAITGAVDAITGGFVVTGYDLTLEALYTDDAINFADRTAVSTDGSFSFTGLPGGTYLLSIVDDSLGCIGSEEFDVYQPEELGFDYVAVPPSCNDTHDGILRYIISGGKAPYMEATNNVGQWENPSEIPAFRWVDTSTEGTEAHDALYFDRRVRGGSYQVWVKDANNCIYGPVVVEIDEPAPLMVSGTSTAVSCNPQDGADEGVLYEGSVNDGTITVDFGGGWDKEDAFDFYLQLKKGSTNVGPKVTFDESGDYTWEGLTAGDYTVELYEYNDTIWDDPIITDVDYFANHDWLSWGPYGQNGNSECVAISAVITVEEPDAIEYDVEWKNADCHNVANGQIVLTNISGGTMGTLNTDDFKGYLVGLQGPTDYDAELQSTWAADYYGTEHIGLDSVIWFETTDDAFTFDNLIWGHYTIHIKDLNGCWIYKESGEIENPDTLKLTVVKLIEPALCYDSTGIIQIVATGGSGNYLYAVDSTLVPHPGSHNFPDTLDAATYLAGLDWQTSDMFDVKAATWVGFVKDAESASCVAGFSTDINGASILHHRTTVLQPTPVVAGDMGEEGATCFDEPDGKILISGISGGNGGSWKVNVFGTDWDGNDVDTTYINITLPSSGPLMLKGLPASTTLDADQEALMTDDDMYSIVVYDQEGCPSNVYMQYVTQPDEFKIALRDKQNAFICPNDQAGLFEIETVEGGTAPFQFKWAVFTDENYTNKVDSLSDDIYGSVPTFLGYAGYYYRVYAIDANECTAEQDTFIQAPEPIVFDVKNITCFGAEKASARVTASGNEGRQYRVLYKEIEGEKPAPSIFTAYNGWFDNGASIDLKDTLLFDTENENALDVHYVFLVEDDLGCRSLTDTLTFDIVQHELMVDATVVSNECTADVKISVTGGINPYLVTLDDVAITDMNQVLDEGSYTVVVTDEHLCTATTVVDATIIPVVRDTMVEVYIGDTLAFTDVESGIDTMLAEGDHVLPYMFGGCERTLNVSVVGVPMPASIIEIQGEVETSPMVDRVVVTSGTVTGVASGEGFYMQDANAAWGGIWVASTETGAIQIGNGVEVIGTVAEVDDVTTLIASDVSLVSPILAVVPVVVATPADAENEMYESVLVTVEGARAMAASTEGEWVIYTEDANDVVVNDMLFAYTPTEGNYYDVTGIVNAKLDAFTLEPRMTNDIVDLTLTGIDDPLLNVQFKVYPNPFNDRITIDNNDKLTRVVVSNIAGQRVIDVEYPSHEIRTANLVSGVYVVSLFTENGIAKTERIVKR